MKCDNLTYLRSTYLIYKSLMIRQVFGVIILYINSEGEITRYNDKGNIDNKKNLYDAVSIKIRDKGNVIEYNITNKKISVIDIITANVILTTKVIA